MGEEKINEVEFRNFAYSLLKEFSELSTEDIQRYYELRKGEKITEKQIKEILKADRRFKSEKRDKKTFWHI